MASPNVARALVLMVLHEISLFLDEKDTFSSLLLTFRDKEKNLKSVSE
jgi:hypothetical protein